MSYIGCHQISTRLSIPNSTLHSYKSSPSSRNHLQFCVYSIYTMPAVLWHYTSCEFWCFFTTNLWNFVSYNFFNGSIRCRSSSILIPGLDVFCQILQPHKVLRNRPIRNKNCLWRTCLWTNRAEMNNLYRGHIYAFYLVSVHLAKRFQRRF